MAEALILSIHIFTATKTIDAQVCIPHTLPYPLASTFGISQGCPINSLGQNPSTAFPVCGTNVFVQASVNLCGGTGIPNPKCNTNLLTDINPYWYKFTCFEAGTLGFTIQPNSNSSDYDWQVFDITDRKPEEVFTDKSISIGSNWSQYFGNTGTSPSASNLFECEGPTVQVSKMPSLIKGHEYLLLVSHFSNTQAGYKLTFGGGTANITDSTTPHLREIYGRCDGKSIGVKLNKKMRCSTLASNGSDFYLSSSTSKIISVSGNGCTSGFDLDSVILLLDQPLPTGTYKLSMKNGSDGNTLLDYCDKPLPTSDTLSITILPGQPTPMDSLQRVACKPTDFYLHFKTPMQCSTIATDGSDFTVSGPSAVVVKSASGSCIDGLTRRIEVEFTGPILVAGLYTITLKTGSDGNTIWNECAKETPAGSFLVTPAYDTVSAAIDYTISSSCLNDTLRLGNAGRINVNNWKWTFDDGIRTTQYVQRIYTSGTKNIVLEVSNGVCKDSSAVSINFDKNRVKADFVAPKFICPLDTAFFTDNSSGPVIAWNWDFGNGNSSDSQSPPYQHYTAGATLEKYLVVQTVYSAIGCSDTAVREILVPNNCYIAVPNAFTPNGDGLNDFLYPLNAYKAVDLHFKVYNRYGQQVWETKDWTKKWDGRMNGNIQASGVYVWQLVYTDPEKQKKIDLKGTTVLIR
jgi:gliding motility-associated-like protein